eukprot:scpid81682/ scgid9630/ 
MCERAVQDSSPEFSDCDFISKIKSCSGKLGGCGLDSIIMQLQIAPGETVWHWLDVDQGTAVQLYSYMYSNVSIMLSLHVFLLDSPIETLGQPWIDYGTTLSDLLVSMFTSKCMITSLKKS